MRVTALAAALLISATGFALAQDQQQVIPPRTVYWMDVQTMGGIAAMGAVDPMQMAFGGGGQPVAFVDLEIASQDAPRRGAVEARHTLPAGAQVRDDLRLEPLGPDTPYEPGEDHQTMEQPRGRLILFFGCAENAPRGQPIIIDFSRIAAGQMPAGLESRIRPTRNPTRPGQFGWPSTAYGPVEDRGSARMLPAGASLVGGHTVRSSFANDITFNLTAAHDVLAPMAFSRNEQNPSGSVALQWGADPRSTGYALMAFGQGERDDDMVFWTSSSVQSWDIGVDGYLAPDEVARLVREGVLLAPSTTQCTVPVEAARALGVGAGGDRGAMLIAMAFGPQTYLIDPPRPTDPRTPWRQNWAVQVRLSASTMEMLGQSFSASMGAGGPVASGPAARDPRAETAPPAGMSQREWCRERRDARRQQAENQTSSTVGGAIGDATGIPGAGAAGRALGGLFGGNRDQEPEDPYCPR
jgi:hypothetical protein